MEPSTVVRPLESVRQDTFLSGAPPRTFTGVFDFVLPLSAQGRAHVVEAMIPDEPAASLTTSPVPAQVGPDWSQPFNVLTMSCFDTATDRGKARLVLRSLPQHLRPHLTLLTGDQVYLDAPTLENLPNDDVALAEVLERKYIHNWSAPGVFSHVLDMAPTVCCPDDHEYWNNYPNWFLFANNTWGSASRQRWMDIGKRLYQCFQHSGSVPFGQPIRVDVSPLSFLVVDTRSFRDDGGNNKALHDNALAAVRQWATSLKASGHIGVFVSGQSLMEDAKGWFGARLKDATLANFDDYAPIMEALHAAMRDGSDILLVTGDVHWSHVTQLEPVDALVNAGRAYEVVCSPASLLAALSPSSPPPIHEWAGSKRQTGMRLPTRMGKDLKGDHACILSFRRIGLRSAPSVELKVTFVPLTPGEPPYELGSTLVLRRR
ncbi:hypothetical protein LXT21_20395 [Myxococcus sp. K38C18041901]|uniref:hypothetical protein n=1 Tax=Myxococcus guangdongensis TaxID=2906760 RepID=UPI0020A7FC99|nr:hypothetical protein [Myxococcus guangdongensis]MCP3061144.1 hypothetical protein [Myxococcus guangdongensis]